MRIDNFIWLPVIVDKIQWKHSVISEEAEEIFFNHPKYRFVEIAIAKATMFIRRPDRQTAADI